MKMRLVVALAGFAISFALPTFAQQTDTIDPKTAQQIRALGMKYDEAFNKYDSAALAALYTEDAVFATPEGNFSGRQAIEKRYVEWSFQRWHSANHLIKVDRVIAVGNEVRAIGKWSCNYQGSGGRTKQVLGNYTWVIVRAGDTWKIRGNTYTEIGSRTVARAAAPARGTVVTGVNQSAHTFTVQWLGTYKSGEGGRRSISHERKTTDKTIYLVGNTKGSWSDVRKGVHVHIVSHAEGSDRVADKVQIVTGS
jgi:uncharacterized protein (TIGR02246 family)